MEWIVEAESIGDLLNGRYTVATKPVIRCKDCKLFGKPRCAMAWWDDCNWSEPDGYCHLAERREEGGRGEGE